MYLIEIKLSDLFFREGITWVYEQKHKNDNHRDIIGNDGSGFVYCKLWHRSQYGILCTLFRFYFRNDF